MNGAPRFRVKTAIVLMAVTFLPASVLAQRAVPTPVWVQRGTQLRIFSHGVTTLATYVRSSSDVLAFTSQGARQELPFAEMDSLQAMDGSSRSSRNKGVAVGLALGGAPMFLFLTSVCEFRCVTFTVVASGVTGILGSMIGAAIGGTKPAERPKWVTILRN